VQGEVSKEAAGILGLSPGTKVSYRAGDQPNNALSLNVLNPGEIATTAGTSGVIYAVHGTPIYDKHSRVNTFVHVNHKKGMPRYGVLMCVNGTGILNRWVRYNLTGSSGNELSYNEMNKLASTAPPGCDGLMILPYGNGAERTLLNKNIEASIHGLNFNIHRREHFFLAAQEGIVFALNYGLEIMREMGLEIKAAKAGNSNMFLSPLFREIFANVTGCGLELFDTDGAQGAARGAGIGCGVYSDFDEAFRGLELIKKISPEKYLSEQYISIYSRWKGLLDSRL
jgi:xylulokinase